MPRVFASVPVHEYRHRWKDRDNYERVETVPDGMTWRPFFGPGDARFTVLCTIGDFYRLIRDRDTGAVVYFKMKDTGPEISPKEKIDAEPPKPKQVRFRKGTRCWFVVDTGHWFLCDVEDRLPQRIVLRPVTGWDVDRQVEWQLVAPLELSSVSHAFKRLRPLAARYR